MSIGQCLSFLWLRFNSQPWRSIERKWFNLPSMAPHSLWTARRKAQVQLWIDNGWKKPRVHTMFSMVTKMADVIHCQTTSNFISTLSRWYCLATSTYVHKRVELINKQVITGTRQDRKRGSSGVEVPWRRTISLNLSPQMPLVATRTLSSGSTILQQAISIAACPRNNQL